MTSDKIFAIIVASGKGTRFGSDIPKQYQVMVGKSVLAHSIETIQKAVPGIKIQCVISKEHESLYSHATENLELLPYAYGGDTRQASVFAGLKAISQHQPEIVLIHDAARPFASQDLIRRTLEPVINGRIGAVPTLPLSDTIKRIENNQIAETMDREQLCRVQTPQIFAFDKIFDAHKACEGQNLTDDAAVLETVGLHPIVVEGDETNIKITYPDDIQQHGGKSMIGKEVVKVGSGFDVHRFEPGNSVTLCGIKIPFSQKLKGHSDADVALHAITDAIFSAIADGDIGSHFPPSEPKWKGASSDIFLRFAMDRVKEKNGTVSHLSVTIICEAPKVGPHREAMRENISNITGVAIDDIAVLATTSEKLGFTGRGEGIAAQATATIAIRKV